MLGCCGGIGHARIRMTSPVNLRLNKHGPSALPLAVLALARAMIVADGAEHAKEWAALEQALATYPAFKRFRRHNLAELMAVASRLALDLEGMLVDVKARFGLAQREQMLEMLADIMAADAVEHPAERALLGRVRQFLLGPARSAGKKAPL